MGVFRQCLAMIRLQLQRIFKALTHLSTLSSHRYKFQLNSLKHVWNCHFIEDPFNFLTVD
ncbi:hypothetical protein Plhal710r2_c006g0029811 [Plasmopara halstedii]